MSKLGAIKQRWRQGLPWAFALIWRTDARSCLCMAGSSLLTALLTPLSVVLMAHIVGILRKAFAEGGVPTVDPWPWILLAGGMTIVGASAAALKKYAQNRLTDSVTLRVRSMLLARAAELDLETLENREQQNELVLLTKDSGESVVKSATELMNLAAYALRVVSLAGIMLAIEPWGTMLILLAAIPMVIVGTLISQARHRLRKSNAETQRWSNYYARHLTQYRLAPEVRLLDLAPWMIKQTENRVGELQRVKRRIDRMDLAFRLSTTVVSVLLLLVAIHRVAQHTAAGTLELERFVAFWLAAWRLARDASTLAGALTNATKAWIEMFHMQAFLRKNEDKNAPPRLSPTLDCGRIELRNVSFRYAGSRTNALSNVSLRIDPGETVAIVGHNGAGKTTLVKLLAGLYRPSSGEIRFGDVPQDELELAELHRQMAIVMQSPMRLEATAGENIALGDRERLWANPDAIRQVALDLGGDAMIQKFPEAYDTQLGKQFGEYDLSGGQWQKIAIMRALARDPRIVLLDEPTSGIDVNAEREILTGMRRLVAGRTAILISHRFSTVAMADRIVVIEDGEVAEQGTHDELLSAGGIYAAMYRTQARHAA